MTIEELIRKTLGEAATDEKVAALIAAAQKETDDATLGLKNNQAKNLDQIANLKKSQLPEGFDQEGFDKYIVEKDEFAKKQKDLDEQKLQDEGQWVALKDKLNAAHDATFGAFKVESELQIGKLQGALDKELIENSLGKEINKEGGNSFFLMPHLRTQVQTVAGENGFTVGIIDANGQPRLDDKGEAFTVKSLVAEAKANEMYAPAFPDQNNGSGKGVITGQGKGSTVNPWKSDTRNVTDQAKMNRENPTLALQMKKAAGVA